MKFKALVCVLALVTALVSAQEAKVYNNGTLDIVPPGTSYTLTAADQLIGVSKIYYRLNNGDQKEYTSPLVFDAEGRYTISYYSEDLLGNVSSPSSFTFMVDATVPVIKPATRGSALVRDGKTYLKSTTGIIINATDSIAGIESIFFSLDQENYIKFNDEAFVNEEGERSAYTYAVDRVGNKSTPVEIRLVVDNTAPSVGIVPLDALQPVRGERYTKPGNTFVVRSADEVSGLKLTEVSINRQEFFAYTDPIVINEPGVYSIRARAIDNLGNTSSVVELNFIVDGAAPRNSIGNAAIPAPKASPVSQEEKPQTIIEAAAEAASEAVPAVNEPVPGN